MFFKRQTESRTSADRKGPTATTQSAPVLKAIPGGKIGNSGSHKTASSDDAVSLVLDALGGVLSALSRYPLDLPQRPADESAQLISAWHRHATLGLPIDPGTGEQAVGIVDRDWNGVVRAITQQRRDEHDYVESAIGELREALWSCVETVHKAVRADTQSDSETETQLERARKAITLLQPGSIRQEVLGAVGAIQTALETRRERQQEQYATLASKLDKLGRQLEEARRESTIDPLTGVGNRKLFDIMGPRAVQLHSLAKMPVVLLMIDLDKLKMVNDMYGHLAGDNFISGVARCLSKVFMRENDVICRYGGDEFAILLQNTDSKVAEMLALRLDRHVSEMPPPHPSMEFKVGVSVGIAQLEAGQELDEWVSRADKALYKAKTGSARVCVG